MKVFLVRNRVNGRSYAAKKVCKFDKSNKSTKKLVVEERKILNKLNSCRHASQFIEFYEENNEYIMVLEHIEGKDLLSFIKDTPEVGADSIKLVLASILLCLKAVHSEKIIHRDIKPHNILIDSELRCKLIDFGLSLDVRHPLEKNHFRKCGTVGYMAPEVFANEFSCLRPYSTQSDMFSFGIVAHMLLMGSNPIKGKSYD